MTRIERHDAVLKSKPITTQVLECLERHSTCEFQTLVQDCSEFTWKQLFYEVDRMRQLGQLYLTSVDDDNRFIGLRRLIGESVKIKRSDTPGKKPRAVAADQFDGESSSREPVDLRLRIARRAYQLYEQQDRQDGYALDHWCQAEREIQSQGTEHPKTEDMQ